MKTSRSGWSWVVVVVGLLIAGGAARGAAYTWDGSGDANASGNWSVIANWNPESAGKPDAGDDVTLPSVTAGTRTITLDAARAFRTLTINQSTAGATNRLLLSANLTSDFNTDLLPTLNASAGTIVIDKGSYNFNYTSGGSVRNWILGPNVILNSSGGQMQDTWQTDKPSITLQGTANFSTALTTMGAGNVFTVDSGGVLNLTSSGAASVGDTGTITNKGTINGNSTGSLKARTVVLDTSSAVPTSIATIYADNLSIRSATAASFDLSGTSLQRNKIDQTASLECAASGAGTNFKIGTWKAVNPGGTAQDAVRTRLVNDYANSGTQTSEYFLVGTFDASGAYNQEFDLNGQRLVIDGGVANCVGGGNLRLSNRSSGHGYLEFRTTGGTLNLNNGPVGLSSGGTLEVVGPASIANFVLADMGTSVGTNGGTFKFNGNVTHPATDTDISTSNSTITIDLVSTANTFDSGRRFRVRNRSIVTFNGKFTGSSMDGGNASSAANFGLGVTGTTKSGTGTPAVTNAGQITITGSLGSGGNGERIEIGRDAALRVGGNFTVSWWSGLAGAANRTFFADTSTHAGSFIFNGGGASVQTNEVLSKGYAVITGLSYYQAAGTAPAAGQTVTGGSSGATATINFINGDILQLTSVSGTFQADETLTFSGGGTARAYDTQFAGLDGQTVGNTTVHLPIGTLCIGDPAGTNAWVKLANPNNPWGVTEDTQVARNLIVTTNSTFDIASFKMVVACGTNSAVAGLITNSVAGGQLILTNGVKLVFLKGGAIEVATIQIAADCVVDFNNKPASYIRVLGNQKGTFDALIAGGQIINTGGNTPQAKYTSADDRTTVMPPPPPRGTSLTLY